MLFLSNRWLLLVLLTVLTTCGGRAHFKEYAALFPEKPLPYRFTGFPARDGSKAIGSKFAVLVPGLDESDYSREVMPVFAPLAELKMKDEKPYRLFAYCALSSAPSPEYAYDQACLATYSENGGLIDTLTLGTRTIYAHSTGRVSAEGRVEIKRYQTVWLKDPVDEGLKANRKLRTSLTATAYYYIDGSGHFVKDSKPAIPAAQAQQAWEQ